MASQVDMRNTQELIDRGKHLQELQSLLAAAKEIQLPCLTEKED